jgi:hypothetical protein
LIAGLPQYDNTDTYAFVSPENDGTVTLVGNWIPFESPAGGPNFYPWATDAYYDFNIDNNGDGKADLIYRYKFTSTYQNKNTFLYNTGVVNNLTDATLNFRQTYSLTLVKPGHGSVVLAKNLPVAPSDVGDVSMPNYGTLRSQAVRQVPTHAGAQKYTSFAGQAKDSFFLDLRVFDLLYGAHQNPNGSFAESGVDGVRNFNVNTIALKVPKSLLALKNNVTRNPVIGMWATTSRKNASGKYVQISRLGNPLVNEVVVPVGLKDAFNSIAPNVDHTITAVVNKVLTPEVPQLVQAIYGIQQPAPPRKDLVEVFLTGISKNSGGPIAADLNSQLLNKDVNPKAFVPSEELRLNMAVASHASPNRLGVLGGDLQGFPNGRRLTDDVVDIELQALEGALPPYGRNLSTLGDGVNANAKPFTSAFPYVGLPVSGSTQP